MPDIGQPSETDKNSPNEIRDGVVSDSTRFPGGFIDQQITEAGAAVQIVGKFSIATGTFVQSFDVSGQTAQPTELTFRPDGSQMYVSEQGSNTILQYSLSTAFDVSTASFVRSFDVSAQVGEAEGIDFRPDGSQMYVLDALNIEVFEYSLSTAFDISTASFDRSLFVSNQETRPTGVTFRPDGTQMYLSGASDDDITQYSVSTAFDVSTAVDTKTFDVSTQDGTPKGVRFKPDGTKMYVLGAQTNQLFEYSLSTAFDIGTASFDRALDISTENPDPEGLAFKPDGSQLYLVGITGVRVNQYNLGEVGAQ